MRHKVESTVINRNSAQLKALVRSLATSIILYESIKTTKQKAKLASKMIDRLITIAKKRDKLSAIRYSKKYLFWKNASEKLIEVLADRYKDRPSWFTRIIKLPCRAGDNAQSVQIQFV